MNFELNKYKNDLLFIPLGGAGEIGMNLNVYHYHGKLLLIDLGIGFASDYCPGTEVIVPNIDFLERHRDKIAGLVLTHAHEDHLGAVPYLWHELLCPIYTTKFTAAVLKAKFSEAGVAKGAKIHELDFNSKFNIGPFELELRGMTHSIPEMHGVLLHTDQGTILHTGDWKFDSNPIIGNASDEKALTDLGNKGILAVVGDSTNIFNEGTSGSEGDLSESLLKIMGNTSNGMLVVTTFASNIARLHSIAKAGQQLGKKVSLLGRSLWRMYEAALQSGYLNDLEPLLADDQLAQFRREDIILICTGSQGEPMAAMTKLAFDNHPRIKITKGDTVIFASKIIPGNDKRIFSLMNQLCKKGIEVLTERDHFVHVSGHPARDEVKKLYQLTQPKISIPVHGEAVHLHEHAKFALECGVQQSIEVSNGDVIRITHEKAEKISLVKAGYLAIDGNFIVSPDSSTIKLRRRMRDSGLVVITLIVGQSGLRKRPKIITPGVLDENEDSELILSLIEDIEDLAITNKRLKANALEKSIRSMVKKVIKKETGKDPYIILQLEHI